MQKTYIPLPVCIEEIKNKMPFELVESEMPKEDPSRFSSTEKIAEEFERVNAKLRELEKQIKQMGNTMILLHPEAC